MRARSRILRLRRGRRHPLSQSLSKSKLEVEAAYLNAPGRASFERPYGLAWLLQTAAELHSWNDPDAKKWADNLRPVETAIVKTLTVWLGKLTRPVRSGEHSNTAFALGQMIDYARAVSNRKFEQLLLKRGREFYLADRACPLTYEPSGEDFLSPCIAEADVMRRVLSKDAEAGAPEFAKWFTGFCRFRMSVRDRSDD